jgi:hypothetical protein
MCSTRPRLISSKLTPLYKFILPALWISLFGSFTLLLFFTSTFQGPSGSPPHPYIKWIFFGGSVIGTAVWRISCIPLKKVLLDGNDLIISNYSRQVRVSLRHVTRISEGRFANPRCIRVAFDERIGFGTRMSFMPEQRFLWPWQEHPTARELRRSTGAK